MREFRDIPAFLRYLETMPATLAVAQHVGLEDAAKMVEAEAKSSIGTYQLATGPFNDWVPLSGATLEGFHAEGIGYVPGKIELGYAPPDNPLLRTGEMRDSINHQVEGNTAVVGSDSDILFWQELGTPNARFPIPPRSILGASLSRRADEAFDLMVAPIMRALAGKSPTNRAKAADDLT